MIEKETTSKTLDPVSRWSLFDRDANGMMIHLMETLDGLGYLATGFSFLLIGIVRKVSPPIELPNRRVESAIDPR